MNSSISDSEDNISTTYQDSSEDNISPTFKDSSEDSSSSSDSSHVLQPAIKKRKTTGRLFKVSNQF